MTALAEPEHQGSLAGIDPPVQLSEHLLPPLKREGLEFEHAWELAWEQIVWPVSMRETRDYRTQLLNTKPVWQAAYEDWPRERTELAMSALSDGDLGDLEFSEAA